MPQQHWVAGAKFNISVFGENRGKFSELQPVDRIEQREQGGKRQRRLKARARNIYISICII